jgi:hypothetical protein
MKCTNGKPPMLSIYDGRICCDTNAVHDRLLQSMRVRFSDSVQRSSLNKFHVCAQTFLFEM